MLEVRNTAKMATFRSAVHYEVDVDVIALPKAARVLDLGCGATGSYIIHELLKRDPDLAITFVDAFKDNLDGVKLPGIKYQGVSTLLPFENESFDLVLTAEMTPDNTFFSHSEADDSNNFKLTQSEIDRVLKPSGLYVAYHESMSMFPVDYYPVHEDFKNKELKNGKTAVGLTYGVYAKHNPDKGSLAHLGHIVRVAVNCHHDKNLTALAKLLATYIVQQLSQSLPQIENFVDKKDADLLASEVLKSYPRSCSWKEEFEALEISEKLQICKMSAIYCSYKLEGLPKYWKTLYHASFAISGSGNSALDALKNLDPSDWLYAPMLQILKQNPVNAYKAKENLANFTEEIKSILIKAIVAQGSSDQLFSALTDDNVPEGYRPEMINKILEAGQPYFASRLLCSEYELSPAQQQAALEVFLGQPTAHEVVKIITTRTIEMPYLIRMLDSVKNDAYNSLELYKLDCLPANLKDQMLENIFQHGAEFYALQLIQLSEPDSVTRKRAIEIIRAKQSPYYLRELKKLSLIAQ